MFPDTEWTKLAGATLHGDEAGRAALEGLCRSYWEPVRRFVVQRGWTQDEAPDLVQSFFHFVMDKGLLRRAEREKGRFRCFLQGVLNNFLLAERDRRLTLKRGGGQEHEELHEETASTDPTAGLEFDRQWAMAVMQVALNKVAAECRARRGDRTLEVISIFIGGPGEAISQEDAAGKLGMPVAAFRSEILQWRQKLRGYLRAEVRRTVGAPHEVEDEMNYLRQLLTAA